MLSHCKPCILLLLDPHMLVTMTISDDTLIEWACTDRQQLSEWFPCMQKRVRLPDLAWSRLYVVDMARRSSQTDNTYPLAQNLYMCTAWLSQMSWTQSNNLQIYRLTYSVIFYVNLKAYNYYKKLPLIIVSMWENQHSQQR